MFAKIFEQIFDSSIAEDWKTRIVFEDMLILADINGVVDKTHEAISRRTNVPIEIIRESIIKLEQPDVRSRRQIEDGRRLIRLDDHRDWGWLIVNYDYYRALASEEQRREKTKERVKKHREKQRCNAPVTLSNDSPSPSSSPSSCSEGDSKGGITGAESKQPYGEFGHVKLSESEHTKLLQKHGEIKLNRGITVLDDYIEARGKRYHNHYAVLKEGSWVWERIGQAPGRTSTASDTINRRKVYEDMQAELAELRSRRWDDDAKQRYPEKWARYHELKTKVAALKREFEAAIT